MRAEEAFVRRFHRDRPGATSRALARGRVIGAAGSSYDRVADAVALGGRVLDLGCGDGFLLAGLLARGHLASDLIGLDVSVDELAAARTRLPAVALVHARAQAIPLAPSSLAAVVSHLAFTMMPDLDDVVAEVARVLTSGGRFITLVGGGPRGDDAFAGLLELGAPYAAAAPPTPRLGEVRGRTDRGLAGLLAPATGFEPPSIDDVIIDLTGTADQVWASLAPSYHLATLTATAEADLYARFVATAPRWRRPDGAIAATMYARLVTAVRR